MNARFFLLLLLLFITGCSGMQSPPPRRAAVNTTPIRYPATWTPSPTPSPRPPTATPTLVVQGTPFASILHTSSARRFPVAPTGIGAWADTTNVSPDLLRELARGVEIVSGPRAAAVRLLNPRAITLVRYDTPVLARINSARPVTNGIAYDALLVERVGTGTESDPLADAQLQLNSLRSLIGNRVLIASTYAWLDGDAYSANARDVPNLLARVDGACVCNFLRRADSPVGSFKSVGGWKKDVDAVASLSRYGNVLLVATRFKTVPGTEGVSALQWFHYALTSYLLGANSVRSYFSFQGPRADDLMTSNEFLTALGTPLGAYYQTFGLYARHYARGLVVVNPGETTRELPLARTHVTSLGEVLTRVTLRPHTGVVLIVQQ